MKKKSDRGMVMSVRLPPHILTPLEEIAQTAGLLVSDVLRVIVAMEVVRSEGIVRSRRAQLDARSAVRKPK